MSESNAPQSAHPLVGKQLTLTLTQSNIEETIWIRSDAVRLNWDKFIKRENTHEGCRSISFNENVRHEIRSTSASMHTRA